tara:strand:+ start:1621 stop:2757 length:1137 start_codon:yes stop_codon:yes gene_type:complete
LKFLKIKNGKLLKKKINRRNFLKKTALISSAVTLSTLIKKPKAKEIYNWKMVTTWPKNFPGLGTGAEIFAKMINESSGGKMNITVFGAGEIVPAFEAMDAVSSGAIEMGHGGPYYWKGKVPASQYLSAIPFGLTPQEQNSWFEKGGGQEIADEIYKKMGCKFFVCGNTGPQMGGWYNKEINKIEDYQGLKMRAPGLGGEVIKAAGGTVVNIHGGELLTSIQSGAIDALEWVGPYNDLAFGIYKAAKYYYYPGWHEPAAILDCFINLEKWNSLPDDLKKIISMSAKAATQQMTNEMIAGNNIALQTLIKKHRVNVKPFPDEVLKKLAMLSEKVLDKLSSSDDLSKKVYKSIIKFRNASIKRSENQRKFLETRSKFVKYE